ncbi:hypothetical protein VIGAN_08101200, partial [Vigna angularis var. angularis]
YIQQKSLLFIVVSFMVLVRSCPLLSKLKFHGASSWLSIILHMMLRSLLGYTCLCVQFIGLQLFVCAIWFIDIISD